MRKACRSQQVGQAALEAVLVMPLMVFVVLGLLQLTGLQHARIMTEYAAYQAARAGVVWSGNSERMHDAALLALLPTRGRTDGLAALARTRGQALAEDALFARAGWPGPAALHGVSLHGRVRVDTVAPVDDPGLPGLGAAGAVGTRDTWQELDFDAADSLPPVGGRARPGAAEEAAERLRRATVLGVRVRYWYELRVPFANWLLFMGWFAANAGLSLRGPVERPSVASPVGEAALAGARGIAHPQGLPTASRSEMALLWALAQGRRYYVPLSATHSMRMQSNFHRKWLLHPAGGGRLPGGR